ncbi:neuralized-like protein 4 isoform X2 [Tachypleus tridentatus]|uniref:neuralized-like protein 4 isoform X2 n=1 Tax=Tachypleus tridentatus TaxID=6853 RepID=UPI003FD32F22
MSLRRLMVGDKVGVQYRSDGSFHVYINGEDQGIAAAHLPKQEKSIWNKESVCMEFHENHGHNVQLLNGGFSARRVSGYNKGLVICSKPLPRGQLFQVRIDKLHLKWTSSLRIGVTTQSPEKLHFTSSSLSLQKSAWVISEDSVFYGGIKVKSKYGPNLNSLHFCHFVGVMVDSENRLHLYVNGIDQGTAASDIPSVCYGLVDIYGQCEQVTIVNSNDDQNHRVEYKEKADKDTGIKEKKKKSQTLEKSVIKNCEYQNTCSRFLATLGLPVGYFVSEHNVCFCQACHKIRADEPYFKKGEPPREYALPFGWCRFALRLPNKVDPYNIQDWHIAFHGTRLGVVRRILDRGELLPPDGISLGSGGKSGKADNHSQQIILSPTVRYAGCTTFSPRHEFNDSKTLKILQARVAFQVYIRPGSYTSGPQRLGAVEPIDLHFSNSELEWLTKEQNSTVLHSLLVRLEGL